MNNRDELKQEIARLKANNLLLLEAAQSQLEVDKKRLNEMLEERLIDVSIAVRI
jgi:hypothetical protein